MGYDANAVKILSKDSWLVNLKLKIQETVNGSVVKEVIMDYPLIISRVQTSIQINPWGLVIQGYDKKPYRIQTEI